MSFFLFFKNTEGTKLFQLASEGRKESLWKSGDFLKKKQIYVRSVTKF